MLFFFMEKFEMFDFTFTNATYLQFVFFTGGIVFLTLIFNGSTTQFLLHLLGMDRLAATKVSFMNCYL